MFPYFFSISKFDNLGGTEGALNYLWVYILFYVSSLGEGHI